MSIFLNLFKKTTQVFRKSKPQNIPRAIECVQNVKYCKKTTAEHILNCMDIKGLSAKSQIINVPRAVECVQNMKI